MYDRARARSGDVATSSARAARISSSPVSASASATATEASSSALSRRSDLGQGQVLPLETLDERDPLQCPVP